MEQFQVCDDEPGRELMVRGLLCQAAAIRSGATPIGRLLQLVTGILQRTDRNSQSPQQGATISTPDDASTIPRISDRTTYKANMVAIDRVIQTEKYHHLVAWGKWLGFTPEIVRNMLEAAARDDAPADAIQKIADRWLRLGDIQNESNRNRVNDLARHPERESLSGQRSHGSGKTAP